MTTPSIADVKAAAEVAELDWKHLDTFDGGERYPMSEERRLLLLARFALSVLNAPGLSAERLAEIQRKEQAATAGRWYFHQGKSEPELRKIGGYVIARGEIGTVPYHQDCGDPDCECYETYVQRDNDFGFIADARQAVPELLAEVLRLRACSTPPDIVQIGPITPEQTAELRKQWERLHNGPHGGKIALRDCEDAK